MLNDLVLKILAVIVLVYFIVDLITSLIGKAMENRNEQNQNDQRHYIEQNYSIELDNTDIIEIKKNDVGLPEIPDSVAKKVSKAKEKMK